MKKMKKKKDILVSADIQKSADKEDNTWSIVDNINNDMVLGGILLRAQDSLKVGYAYTYQDLTKLLGIKKKNGGTSKEAQMKSLSRLFNYEKDGRYYIISEIYPEVQIKESRKIRSDDIYNIKLQKVLLRYLMDNDNGSHYIMNTTKYWWFLLGMINRNYLEYFKNSKRDQLVEKLKGKVTREDVDLFFYTIGGRFGSIFSKAIKKLEDRMLIVKEDVFIIKYANKDYFVEADEREISCILDSKKSAAKELNIKSEKQVIFDIKLKDKFWKLVSEYELTNYNMAEVYQETKIIYGERFLKDGIKEIENELYEKLSKKCNDVFIYAGNVVIDGIIKRNKTTMPDGSNADELLSLLDMNTNDITIGDNVYENYKEAQQYLLQELIAR